MVFTVDEAGFVATFPQGSGTLMAGDELAGVAAAGFLHQPCDGSCSRWSHEEVGMVVHSDLGVQQAAGVLQCLAEDAQPAVAVAFLQEARLAIVATLDNVLRNAGQVEAWLSGHAARFAAFLAEGRWIVLRASCGFAALTCRKVDLIPFFYCHE
jgi:hypothetical protein